MHIKVKKEQLQKGLQKVQGFTDSERSSTMPILSHILMETEGDGLNIKATDLHTSIQVKMACDIEEPGACTVHSKGLLDITRELPNGDISMNIHEDGRIHITLNRYRFKLNIMDPEEYPLIDFSKIDEGIVISPDIIKFMIDNTFFSISQGNTGELKYTLEGAHLVTAKDGDTSYLEMATTDAKRLAFVRRPIDRTIDTSSSIIIPRKGLQEIRRLIETSDTDASMRFTEGSLYFVSDDTIATVRLMSGSFPEYAGVIKPDAYPIKISVDSGELLSALKVCSALLSEMSNSVRFVFSGTTTTLYAKDPEKGDVEVTVDSSQSGPEVDITFNPKYFIDCLSMISGEAVILLKNSEGPCLIMPGNDPDRRWLIMPMRY
ncbi:MAG: DNA polymerase III subunit beta [Deltaproteobacteria bacterium]|nr:DNA polymerase III subunit beta [Deltaproteobacteria bacterium]